METRHNRELDPQATAYDRFMENYWQDVRRANQAADAELLAASEGAQAGVSESGEELSAEVTVMNLAAALANAAEIKSQPLADVADRFKGVASLVDAGLFEEAGRLFNSYDFGAAYELIDGEASSESARRAMRTALDSRTSMMLDDLLEDAESKITDQYVKPAEVAYRLIRNLASGPDVVDAMFVKVDAALASVLANSANSSKKWREGAVDYIDQTASGRTSWQALQLLNHYADEALEAAVSS